MTAVSTDRTATDELADEQPTAEAPEIVAVRRTRRRGGRVKQLLIVTHRWTSLILGLVLVVVCTSGALLLYHTDIERWTNSEAYAATPTDDPMPVVDALAVVAAAEPDFEIGGVLSEHDVYRVYNPLFESWISVDPGTGDILGRSDDGGGAIHWTLDLMVNVHDCWLSCEGLPGYTPFFAAEVPGIAPVTWGALVLGVMGLLLLFLALSGVWLWWPSFKRFAHGVRVRWSKGRYARDFDLHQVLGMVSLPFLLMWAVTGAGYELPFVGSTYYAVTPGPAPEETLTLSEESDATTDITPAEAVEAAAAVLPEGAVLTDIALPFPDDPTATYYTYWAVGFDPWGHSDYPGDSGVAIDRHTGAAVVDYSPPGQSVAADLWESWNYPTHAGVVVNPWWRLVWFVMGMVPLVLAITGMSTWLYKRGVRKRRRRALAERAAVPAPAG